MNKRIKTIDSLKDSAILYDKNPPAFGYILLIIFSFVLVFATIWSIKTPKTYMVTASGKIESVNKNYVMSPFAGEINNINITEGMNVEKGDVLFNVKSVDLNVQDSQLQEQAKIYEKQIEKYGKLVKSIKDDINYFDSSKSEDTLYYSQFEAYKSQVAQNNLDTSAFKSYGYTDEQIQSELEKNKGKVTEIYYSSIKSAEDSITQCQMQLESINAQLNALGVGKSEYTVTANASGKIHMMSQYKEGMVVQATAAIASIASVNDEYVIESYVSPSDSVRVEVGDKVDIEVSGLIQSVYGTITGKVISKDTDITTIEGSDGKSVSYLKIQVKPESDYLVNKSGDKVNISNGMEVETRIEYDKVTYFKYILECLGLLNK